MTLVTEGPVTAPSYAVVGTRSGDTNRHVALLAVAGELACGNTVQAHDMGGAEGVRLPGNNVVADVYGWLDGEGQLNSDEIEGIDDWIAQVQTQVKSGQLRNWSSYVVLPAVEVDRLGNRPIYRRFSCAGFVAEAYAEGAGVNLVDQRSLPAVDLAFTEKVWGAFPPRLRGIAGLGGDGPWPALLPGYLLSAMRFQRGALPLVPSLSDANVPTRNPATVDSGPTEPSR